LFGYFKGVRPYHNYTREINAKQQQARRNMIELKSSELLYFNRTTHALSNKEDPEAIQFVHFYLRGQSFLYN